jgi:membrane-bound serine protease (ClpP class)
MRVAWRVLLPGVVTMAAWTILLVRLVLNAQRLRPTTGASALIGQLALAEEDLGPEGWVRVQGERWRAVSDGLARAGERLRVVAVEGLRLRVRKEGP